MTARSKYLYESDLSGDLRLEVERWNLLGMRVYFHAHSSPYRHESCTFGCTLSYWVGDGPAGFYETGYGPTPEAAFQDVLRTWLHYPHRSELELQMLLNKVYIS
jgi:hypothetical protein